MSPAFQNKDRYSGSTRFQRQCMKTAKDNAYPLHTGWVMAVGACASSGGILDTYSVLQGIDEVIPVDVYVPGCPPRPEAIIDGFIGIQKLVQTESLRRRNTPEYQKLLASYGIQ